MLIVARLFGFIFAAHWQLPRDTVEIGKRIGAGEFGDVCDGIMSGTGKNEGMKAKVAIKTMKEAHKAKKREFLEVRTHIKSHSKMSCNYPSTARFVCTGCSWFVTCVHEHAIGCPNPEPNS